MDRTDIYSMLAMLKRCRKPVSNCWQIRIAARLWVKGRGNTLGAIFVPVKSLSITKNCTAKPSLRPDLPRLLPKEILPYADTLCRCGMRTPTEDTKLPLSRQRSKGPQSETEPK